jgi:hypothetical protein
MPHPAATSAPIEQARPPIASLISKSEKAQHKLMPGTWQHSMLENNLKALRLADGLMNQTSATVECEGLHEAARALDSMIDRTAKVLPKFPSGSSQHSLLRNRLAALQVARTLMTMKTEHKT